MYLRGIYGLVGTCGSRVSYHHFISEKIWGKGLLTTKHAPLLRRTVAQGVCALGDAGLDTLWLIEGNTQRFGAHAGSLGILGLTRVLLVFTSTHVLDLVLTLLRETVGDDTDVLVVEGGDELVPVGDELAVGAVFVVRAVVQVLLDGVQHGGDSGGQFGDGDGRLAVLSWDVTAGGSDEVACGLAGTELDTQRHTAEFPFVELPAGGVALTHVGFGANAGSGEDGSQTIDFAIQLLALFICGLGSDADRDDYGLGLCNARGQDQATVVTVDHDHNTQGTGGETPGVLPDVQSRLLLIALDRGILDGDVEHLTEVLAKTVRCTTLNTTASGRDITLNGCGIETTSKLFLFGLLTLDNRNSQEFLVDPSIEVKNLDNFVISTLLGQVCRVALLPEELSGSEKRLGVLELPPNNRVPLVQLQRQVTMASDPFGVVRVHNSFRRGTDGNLSLERGRASGKEISMEQ